jgi:hypothetical protein
MECELLETQKPFCNQLTAVRGDCATHGRFTPSVARG